MVEEDDMNQFFNSHMQNQQQGFGPNFDWNSAIQNMARQIAPTGMSPEQIVRQLLQNDRMKPEQRRNARLIKIESLGEVPQGSLLSITGSEGQMHVL